MARRVIACIACLDETVSVHTQTFKRAVGLCEQHVVPRSADVELLLLDDGANGPLAAQVAARAVAMGVSAVVGHFSSSAAGAAAPVYEAAHIPLFLPAATASDLTRHQSTYRLCDNDDDYCAFLVSYCRDQRIVLADIRHDGSLHGESVAKAARQHADKLPKGPGANAAVLFSGSYVNSLRFVRERKDNGDVVLLTDDALAPEFEAQCAGLSGDIRIIGLAPRIDAGESAAIARDYARWWRSRPGIYFWETVAAIQVALASLGRSPCTQAWPSVMGSVKFDAQREFRPRQFTVHRLGAPKVQEAAA